MFDIGAGELVVVALVALLMLQPRDLPKLMRSLGSALAMLRRRQADLHRMIVTMERQEEQELSISNKTPRVSDSPPALQQEER